MLICFAEAKAQFGSFFNAAAAWFTGGRYCHVAVVFELQNRDGTRSYSEVVVIKTGNKREDVVKLCEVEDFTGWTCYRLTFNDPEMERNCLEYVQENWVGKPYDKVGSVLDFTFCWCCPRGYRSLSDRDNDDQKTYCSRLTMNILQFCGQFPDRDPEKVSPNDIHKMIKEDNKKKPGKWEDVSSTANDILQSKNVSRFQIAKKNPDGTTTHILF